MNHFFSIYIYIYICSPGDKLAMVLRYAMDKCIGWEGLVGWFCGLESIVEIAK